MYDLVFISYNEPNAEENYNNLKQRFPTVKRVDGVRGIHQAHIAAAKKCFTKMFWAIDGDAKILESFDFNYKTQDYNIKTVHVWHSINPINGLVYGYGGVKLLPRQLTLSIDISKPDMTTSISKSFKTMPEISNITAFDTDPFNVWKSAFRECVKLSSKTIQGQVDKETDQRLETWCTKGIEKPLGKFAIAGANEGRKYGKENAGNENALSSINDFDWLQELFQQQQI